MRYFLVLVLAWVAGGMGVGCSGIPRHSQPFEMEAVAADHQVASRAGARMLARGGNAVDAAVAASFTLSVVRPYSCGIGGGGFMVIRFSGEGRRQMESRGMWPPGRPLEAALNYRETAPGAVGPDFYEGRPGEASTRGGTAVGVPGTVPGLLYALETYGTLDRKTVMAPAIAAAEEGFVVDDHYISSAGGLIGRFERNPEWKSRFTFVWERFLLEGRVKKGDRIRLPEQAAALRLIAERGASAFTAGPIADAIIEAVGRDGGVLTREDMASYRVMTARPLAFTAFGRAFLTMPPPSSGGVALGQAMMILERTMPPGPREPGFASNVPQFNDVANAAWRASRAVRAYREGALYLHTLAESLKHAFADRSRWMGDPAFVDVPTERLLSTAYIDALAGKVDWKRTLASAEYGGPAPEGMEAGTAEDGGTSHLCVVDRWGSAVACTETINLEFGSLLAVERYGFVLNNQMDDFTTRRGRANAFGLVQSERNLPAPGKRPLSSMTPTIVVGSDGGVEIVAGASGGPRIITGTMQAILNAMLFTDPAGEAVARARLHHQWMPDVLKLEAGLMADEALVSDLIGKGHKVEAATTEVSNVQMIVRRGPGFFRPGAGLEAACDPRKGGRPAGR